MGSNKSPLSGVAESVDVQGVVRLGAVGVVQQQTTFHEALVRAAAAAHKRITGADGASAAVIFRGRVDVEAASNAFAADVDTVQYSMGQGPCVTAAADGRTVQTHSLGREDSRWAPFGAATRTLGLRSVLSLPLLANEVTIGSLNVYAHATHAFDDAATDAGQLIADLLAAAALDYQPTGDSTLTTRPPSVADTQTLINAAVGVLMLRSDSSEDDARCHLHQIAAAQRQPIAASARAIVHDARFWAVKTKIKRPS